MNNLLRIIGTNLFQFSSLSVMRNMKFTVNTTMITTTMLSLVMKKQRLLISCRQKKAREDWRKEGQFITNLKIFYHISKCFFLYNVIYCIHFSIIVDKIDKDKDGEVTEPELKEWIQYVQRRYIVTDTDRMWKDHAPDEDNSLSWESYQKRTFGYSDGKLVLILL